MFLRTVAVLLFLAIAPAANAAPLGLKSFSVTPSDLRAGAHSDVAVSLQFTNASDDLKGMNLRLPAGLLGNPQATPRCALADFQADACPANTTVGSTSVAATALGLPLTNPGTVYNVVPGGDEPARLGIVVRPVGGLLGKVFLLSPITIRDGSDYGLTADISSVPNTLNGIQLDITGLTLTLNGMAGGKPFMTNPTTCAPATAGVTVNSYSGAVAAGKSSFTPTACDSLGFAPNLAVTAADPRTDLSTAITAQIGFGGDVGGRQQSHVRKATVVLPDGVAFSPAVADGLAICTPEQFGYPADTPAGCPAASDIGTVAFDTPLLGTLPGHVYFARDADHPFRVFVVAEQGSVRVKLIGEVTADPSTGRLTTVFDNLPQVPFTRFALSFRGGDHSVLTTAPTCGGDPARATLVPWSGGSAVSLSSAMPLSADGQGHCGIPFRPALSASTTSTAAGGPTALTMHFTRPERDQRIGHLTAKLPAGLVGKLASFKACTSATGACPASTRLGSVSTVLGSGGAIPTTLNGSVYLGPPIGGSLASLLIVVPAQVGPIDLGTMVLPAALKLDPRDGRVTVDAPVPAAFNGIPLALRALSLTIDRDGFLVNPTGCEPRSFDATVTSTTGSPATVTAPYQATACEKLAFKPKLSVTGKQKGPIKNGQAPSITLRIDTSPAGTGLKTVTAVFPKSLQARVKRLEQVCSKSALTAEKCPKATQIGTASARTPLLAEPLSGPVYIALTGVKQPDLPGLELPSAVVFLRAKGVDLRIDGQLRLSPRGSVLQGTFDGLPDVPLSRFQLSFSGGDAGSFLVAQNPCKPTSPRLQSEIVGQNALKLKPLVRPKIDGCKKGYKKGKPPRNVS